MAKVNPSVILRYVYYDEALNEVLPNIPNITVSDELVSIVSDVINSLVYDGEQIQGKPLENASEQITLFFKDSLGSDTNQYIDNYLGQFSQGIIKASLLKEYDYTKLTSTSLYLNVFEANEYRLAGKLIDNTFSTFKKIYENLSSPFIEILYNIKGKPLSETKGVTEFLQQLSNIDTHENLYFVFGFEENYYETAI
jgi:hypothetical protein